MKYTKKSDLALIPFLVFIVIYLSAGLIYQARGEAMAFYMFPSVKPCSLLCSSPSVWAATGTSMGTISALIPIAIGVAEKGNLSPTVVIAAVVGGSMFGDNLSMISDTTIAATRSSAWRCATSFA